MLEKSEIIKEIINVWDTYGPLVNPSWTTEEIAKGQDILSDLLDLVEDDNQ